MRNRLEGIFYLLFLSGLLIAVLIISIHFVVLKAEIKNIDFHVRDNIFKINSDFEKATLQTDVYRISELLKFLKDDRIYSLDFSSSYLQKKGFEVISVGDVALTSTSKKSMPISVSYQGSFLGEVSYVIDYIELSYFLFNKNSSLYLFLIFVVVGTIGVVGLLQAAVVFKIDDSIQRSLKRIGLRSENEPLILEKSLITKMPIFPIKSVDELFRSIESLLIEESERAKDVQRFEIAKQVAHDIRSPLSALKVLSKNTNFAEASQQKLYEQVIGRLNSIAEGVLTIGTSGEAQEKIEDLGNADGPSIELDPHSFLKIVENVLDMKKCEWDEGEIRLTSYLKEVKPIRADGDGLSRIISNILNNSKEAGATSITLSSIVEGENLFLEIRDNGRGMSDELLEKVRHGGRVSSKISGNGLGISSAYAVLKAWDGVFSISSTIGVGTTLQLGFKLV